MFIPFIGKYEPVYTQDPVPEDQSCSHTTVTAKIIVESGALGILWTNSTGTPFDYSLFDKPSYELMLPLVVLVDVPKTLIDTLAFM